MNVTHADILELFVEAAARGGSFERCVDIARSGGRVQCRHHARTPLDTFSDRQRTRAIDRGLRRDRALRAPAVHRVAIHGQIVGVHLAPLTGERVRECPCGGYLERRVGSSQLQHIGDRSCKAPRR